MDDLLLQKLNLGDRVTLAPNGTLALPEFYNAEDAKYAAAELNRKFSGIASSDGTRVSLKDVEDKVPAEKLEEFRGMVTNIVDGNKSKLNTQTGYIQRMSDRLAEKGINAGQMNGNNPHIFILNDEHWFKSPSLARELAGILNSAQQIEGREKVEIADSGTRSKDGHSSLYLYMDQVKPIVQNRGVNYLDGYADLIVAQKQRETDLTKAVFEKFGEHKSYTDYLALEFDNPEHARTIADMLVNKTAKATYEGSFGVRSRESEVQGAGVRWIDEKSRWIIKIDDVGLIDEKKIDQAYNKAQALLQEEQKWRDEFGASLGGQKIVPYTGKEAQEGYHYRLDKAYSTAEIARSAGGAYLDQGEDRKMMKVVQDGSEFFLVVDASQIGENSKSKVKLRDNLAMSRAALSEEKEAQLREIRGALPAAESMEFKDTKIQINLGLQETKGLTDGIEAFKKDTTDFAVSSKDSNGNLVLTIDLAKKPDNLADRFTALDAVVAQRKQEITTLTDVLDKAGIEGMTRKGEVFTSAPIAKDLAQKAVEEINKENGSSPLATLKDTADGAATISLNAALTAEGMTPEIAAKMAGFASGAVTQDKQNKEAAVEAERQRVIQEEKDRIEREKENNLAKVTRKGQLDKLFGAVTEQGENFLLPQVLHNKDKANEIVANWIKKDPKAAGALSVVELEEEGQTTYRVGVNKSKILQVEVMRPDPSKPAQTGADPSTPAPAAELIPTEAAKDAKAAMEGEMAAFKQRLADAAAAEAQITVQKKEEEKKERIKQEDEEKRKNSRNSMINWSVPLIVGVAAVLLLGGGGITLMGVLGAVAVAGAASLITQNVTGTGLFAPKKQGPGSDTNPNAAETPQESANLAAAQQKAAGMKNNDVSQTSANAGDKAVSGDVNRTSDPNKKDKAVGGP